MRQQPLLGICVLGKVELDVEKFLNMVSSMSSCCGELLASYSLTITPQSPQALTIQAVF